MLMRKEKQIRNIKKKHMKYGSATQSYDLVNYNYAQKTQQDVNTTMSNRTAKLELFKA